MKTKSTCSGAALQNRLSLVIIIHLFAFVSAYPQPSFFALPVLNPYGIVEHSSSEQLSSVLLADIDQDGIVEAFVEIHHSTEQEEQDFLYYENARDNEIPLFSIQESYPFQIVNQPGIWPRQFVDIDGDARPDLFFWAWAKGAKVRMQRNVGNPQHPKFDEQGIVENPFGIVLPKTPLMTDHILDAVTPTFVDIDSDGDYDLFYGGAFFNNEADEGYYFARNNDPSGNGTQPQFGLPERNPFGLILPFPGYHRVSFVDQDCDGDYDLYTYVMGSGLLYHENMGTPAEPLYSEEHMHSWPLDAYNLKFRPTSGNFLDINGDADLDLICGGSLGAYFFRNDNEQQGAVCINTPTQSLEPTLLLNAYPNPANSRLFLEFHNRHWQGPAVANIFNINGQLLLQQRILGAKCQINTELLPPGIYTLTVQQGRQLVSRKLVK